MCLLACVIGAILAQDFAGNEGEEEGYVDDYNIQGGEGPPSFEGEGEGPPRGRWFCAQLFVGSLLPKASACQQPGTLTPVWGISLHRRNHKRNDISPQNETR